MTKKSPEEEVLEIADSGSCNLTDVSVETLESLLRTLKPGEKADWSVVAHFLMGLHHSDLFWKDGFPMKSELSASERLAAEKVVEHFTAFLQAATRPCFGLSVAGEEIELPDLSKNWWATFGVDWGAHDAGRSENRVLLTGESDEIDLVGVAMDRLALAHYVLGEPALAADSLVAASVLPSSDYWHRGSVDLTRLHGWIGWLFFDAGDFAKAAAYLQRCFDELRGQPDEGSSPVTAAFVRLAEMYMYGGNDGVDWRHAIADAGNVEAYGDFLPSGTLNRGCDAFLLRLAVAHAATGDLQKAMDAADMCVRFGEPLEDIQFEVYQDFKPVPFPEARLLRAALSLQLNEGQAPLVDLATCIRQSENFRSDAVALAGLHILRSENRAEAEGTIFSALARHLSACTEDEQRRIEQIGEGVLSELLGGWLMSRGIRSKSAGAVFNQLMSFVTESQS